MLLHVLGPRVNKIYYYYRYEILTQYTFIVFPNFYLGGILIFFFFDDFLPFSCIPLTENRENGGF